MLTFSDYLKLSNSYTDNILCHSGLHLVIGNESCDLDSMVSALALAYLYHLTKYNAGRTKVIPVMNMLSSDFPARTENVYLLNKCHLDPKHLVFKDEINLEEIFNNKGLKVSLVDHHVLPPEMKFLKECVVDIHDHRPIDESEVWGDTVEVNIQQVGSCCTIIADKIYKTLEQCLCTGMPGLSVIPLMLYATIIFDTVGLKPEAGKAKELDVEMIEKLEQVLKPSKPRTEAFDELWAAHNDCSELTSLQLLSKDLKVVGDVFVPGLPMLVEDFLQRNGVRSAVSTFYQEKQASLLVLMGLNVDSEVHRDLALYHPKHNSLLPILKKNLMSSSLNLQVKQVSMPHLTYYRQENVKFSRKQVIPIIKESIEMNKSK